MQDPLVELFLNHLRIDKGASPHTLSSYGRDLVQFLRAGDSPLLSRKESDIEDWLGKLRDLGQKPSSVARKISALKQFYKFLLREELIKEDPTLFIGGPGIPKKLPKALDERAVAALLFAADRGIPYTGSTGDALRLRDRAMVYLLYATGVRVSELIGIERTRFDAEAGLLRVLGKRNKERVIPFAPVAGELVIEYLEKARPTFEPRSDRLFLGQTGLPLTRQAFWKTLKRLATIGGVPVNLHPHMLRHTFASDLLRSGMNLRSLQSLLGHADLQTTQIYTHIVPESLREVIEKYHPRGKK
jgi:integrase/recombinase XerD